LEAAEEVLDFIDETVGGGGMETLERFVDVVLVSGSACFPFLWVVFDKFDSKEWEEGPRSSRFGSRLVVAVGSVLDRMRRGSSLALSIEESD